jgi:hypothetical protein
MMTNEETKARQALRDARGNKRYIQPEPIKVLDPAILKRLNTLPNASRIKFMRALQVIETLPAERRQKEMVSLLNSIFISSESVRSGDSFPTQETDH